jgi:hypothetical protein
VPFGEVGDPLDRAVRGHLEDLPLVALDDPQEPVAGHHAEGLAELAPVVGDVGDRVLVHPGRDVGQHPGTAVRGGRVDAVGEGGFQVATAVLGVLEDVEGVAEKGDRAGALDGAGHPLRRGEAGDHLLRAAVNDPDDVGRGADRLGGTPVPPWAT